MTVIEYKFLNESMRSIKKTYRVFITNTLLFLMMQIMKYQKPSNEMINYFD
jgi:hypothetical protein